MSASRYRDYVQRLMDLDESERARLAADFNAGIWPPLFEDSCPPEWEALSFPDRHVHPDSRPLAEAFTETVSPGELARAWSVRIRAPIFVHVPDGDS